MQNVSTIQSKPDKKVAKAEKELEDINQTIRITMKIKSIHSPSWMNQTHLKNRIQDMISVLKSPVGKKPAPQKKDPFS